MDELSVYTDAGRAAAAISKPQPGLLLELLLSDAATDIEVVTRELDLRDEMRERLRRALDRVACAQSVLETMRAESEGTKSEETRKCAEAGVRQMGIQTQMWEAVRLLAKEWPEEYPAGAVEWMVVERARTSQSQPSYGDS